MDTTFPELLELPALSSLGQRALQERLTVGGAYGSARALALAALARDAPVVALVADVLEAEGLEDDLHHLARGTRVIMLQQSDPAAAGAREGRADFSEKLARLTALARLGAGAVALVPVAVLLEDLPEREELARGALLLRAGEACDLEDLRRRLHAAGYVAVPMVSAPAEFSLRGDILDVFPLAADGPLRLELFDERIESIRAFDVETQRSRRARSAVTIPVVREGGGSGARAWLAQHLPAEALLARSDPARLEERLEEHAAAAGVDRALVRRARALLDRAAGVDLVTHKLEESPSSLNLATLSVQGLGGGVDGLAQSLATLRQRCPRAVVFAESDGELRRLGSLLRERSLFDANLHLRKGRVRCGFQLLDTGVAVLNHMELLGHPRLFRPRPRRPLVVAKVIQNILELSEGDHVVHLAHGIARYNGMTRLKRDQGEEDFLVLEFAGGTILYHPIAKIDLVQRYIGAGGTAPRLDRIGGRSWARKKEKVQAALAGLAQELLEVQAARELRDGTAHPADDPLLADFDGSFPFPDTPDQARAMRDIQRDLEGKKPMDRLLCGDVGFGKTELAVRAAFRVVCGGRQVAMLVPTTILAEQHHQTFLARMAQFPVQVASLSRFRSKARQQAILQGLAAGTIDVAVGTHRLISRDVAFKNLGLVIIDEEQRFGVKAKEALKLLRRTVDVLTLTATPIPRTLHMALVGIRDISALNTPPPGRRPVRTEIRKFEPALVRRALLFELNRGGQVFVIHNRVRTIERLAQRILELAPAARVAVAHGQMAERELEAVTRTFARGEIDVLVATSIVESGLDLPRVNTMFIDRPDLFGLADLHQLRGRIGRSEVQAFCCLLVPDRPLPAAAEKRLKAIEELSHLGAGYDIAIKDLEIRGAGNLLGAEQHGHIAAVGYDLFVQLLRRAVARARGAPPPREPLETDVDLGADAFLPAEYVQDPGQRMELLRRMSAADGPPLLEMEAELRDRFGRPPPPARNLLTVFALKRRSADLGLRRVIYPGDDHVILEVADLRTFRAQNPFRPGETVQITNTLAHLRLPLKGRRPQAVLDLLAERLL